MAAAVVLTASSAAQDNDWQARNQDPDFDSVSTPPVQSSLSAESIIAILRQVPDLLALAKQEAGLRLAVDPGTITDDAIYAQIRRDANLRMQITGELSRRGYDVSSDVAGGPIEGAPQASSRQNPRPTERDDEGTQFISGHDGLGASLGESPSHRVGEDGESDETTTAPRGGKMAGRPKAEARPAAVEETTEPRMVRRPNPYPKIPSLQDLYSQFPSAEVKLKRFGGDVFRYGTGNADALPMDLPAGPDYVLGPGDGLVLNLWGSISERLNRTVDRQGQIALPEAGP
ncbi:MAG: polysaccharide biosynthesis/export family protein, partial [Terriglobales bacterium]